MAERRPRILVVDDDRAVVDVLVELLGELYDVAGVVSARVALQQAGDEDIDLVVADVEMPEMRGTELVERLQQQNPGQLVLLITAFGSIELAVQAVRAGACDFVSKPFTTEALVLAIERALRERKMRREIVRLRQALAGGDRDIIATSAAMRHILDLAARAARSRAPVLVTGESGVGKRAIARWIHDHGPRRAGPLIHVSCAALPSGLIEAELFGVRAGALPTAREVRDGMFAEAGGGTVVLDEIAELPLDAQLRLLHVLETSSVHAAAGAPAAVATAETDVDARVIATTNASLENAVKAGKFRRDLFYRLSVIPLEIPPLRDRREDIPDLVHAILERASRGQQMTIGIADNAVQWLLCQPWEGNVRQLANVLERAVALTDNATLTLEDVAGIDGGSVDPALDGSFDVAAARHVSLSAFEHAYIRQVIAAADGNMSRAARILGIDRRTLYRKLAGEP